jgi:Protein of unknown function (DUF2721)
LSRSAPPSTSSAEVAQFLNRRMVLLNRAILFCVLSAFCTALLLIVSFVCALLGINHRTGVALMFVAALSLLAAALWLLAAEVRVNLKTLHLD